MSAIVESLGVRNGEKEREMLLKVSVFVAAFAFALGCTALGGVIFAWMWNLLVPSFGGPAILWWQAWLGLGLLGSVGRALRGFK